jgi:hypothetical protein
MHSLPVRTLALALVGFSFTGCYTAVTGPDGGVVAAGAGPRRAGVVVDPPGPSSIVVGTSAPRPRRAVVVAPPPSTVVVLPASAPRVVYRGRTAYFWKGNYYRRVRGGYVVIR